MFLIYLALTFFFQFWALHARQFQRLTQNVSDADCARAWYVVGNIRPISHPWIYISGFPYVYFLYANSECPCETAPTYTQAHLSICCYNNRYLGGRLPVTHSPLYRWLGGQVSLVQIWQVLRCDSQWMLLFPSKHISSEQRSCDVNVDTTFWT